jgi:hypothetical protein
MTQPRDPTSLAQAFSNLGMNSPSIVHQRWLRNDFRIFRSSASVVCGQAGKGAERTGVPPITASTLGLPETAKLRGTAPAAARPIDVFSKNSRRLNVVFFCMRFFLLPLKIQLEEADHLF